MGARGMIINERVEQVLSAAVCRALFEHPQVKWSSPEELAAALPCLARCDDGRYEVVPLGAIASIDEVQIAAEHVGIRFGKGRPAYPKTA